MVHEGGLGGRCKVRLREGSSTGVCGVLGMGASEVHILGPCGGNWQLQNVPSSQASRSGRTTCSPTSGAMSELMRSQKCSWVVFPSGRTLISFYLLQNPGGEIVPGGHTDQQEKLTDLLKKTGGHQGCWAAFYTGVSSLGPELLAWMEAAAGRGWQRLLPGCFWEWHLHPWWSLGPYLQTTSLLEELRSWAPGPSRNFLYPSSCLSGAK